MSLVFVILRQIKMILSGYTIAFIILHYVMEHNGLLNISENAKRFILRGVSRFKQFSA